MKHAIMRNFGGLQSVELDPYQEFSQRLNMSEQELNPVDYEDFEEVIKIKKWF